MASFRLARIATILIALALLAAACGSSGSTESAPASAANPDAVGASLGELATTSGEPFMFSSVVDEPTVLWFWGPG